MAYYVIFDVMIHDLPKYQEYMARIKPVIEASGGRAISPTVSGQSHVTGAADPSEHRLSRRR